MRLVWLAAACVLMVLLSGCGGGGGSSAAADCSKVVIRELPVDNVNPRGIVGLDDGTLYRIDPGPGELIRVAPDGGRVTASVNGDTAGSLDFLDGQLWLGHGRPSNRVEVYDAGDLRLVGTASIEIGQPVAVFPAGDEHVLVQVAEGGAVVLTTELDAVDTIVDNGDPVPIGSDEYAMLGRTLVQLGCS